MKLFKNCPNDCYLLEEIPDIDNGNYIYQCRVKKRRTKCMDYLQKVPGSRSADPILLYYAITNKRWKRLTILVAVLSLLVSVTTVFLHKGDKIEVKHLQSQYELLLKENIVIQELIAKFIERSKHSVNDSTKNKVH